MDELENIIHESLNPVQGKICQLIINEILLGVVQETIRACDYKGNSLEIFQIVKKTLSEKLQKLHGDF